MSMDNITVNPLDRVKLLTTKNVSYLSAPPDEVVDPHGIWVVACNIGPDLMLTKGNITIRIPYLDVVKIGTYDLKASLEADLRNVMYGKKERKK
jgi:hypothetical protein